MPVLIFKRIKCVPTMQYRTTMYGVHRKQWRHNERVDISYNRGLDCLLIRLFRRKSKRTSKLRVTGLCEGNSPGTGEFPAQRTSNAENVSIWWRHHENICWFEVWFVVISKALWYNIWVKFGFSLSVKPLSIALFCTETYYDKYC